MITDEHVIGTGRKIYIPHWLDSMAVVVSNPYIFYSDLHSTLVRFYGEKVLNRVNGVNLFTFHTG